MNIDPAKLDALHEYIQAGGSTEQPDVAKQLGVKKTDTATVDAYVDALKEKFPDDYGDPEPEGEVEQLEELPTHQEEPVEPAKTNKDLGRKEKIEVKVAESPYLSNTEFVLLGENNTPTILDVVKASPGKIILKVRENTEFVNIMLRGRVEAIDLVQIRKLNGDVVVAPHGVTANQLLTLADLARG